ncbi:MAG: arsenite efflux transporter metallochaperone ArsD [Negativicutes bacterium]|nr:arsenite efflux transporter metallochaperone ArsD [Negativicutes bacterium]
MTIEIYDPPMCCPTGVCGPTTDPALLEIQETMIALKNDGVEIGRYSLTHHIQQFMNNSVVAELLNSEGLDALPITMINGQLYKTKGYPSYEELKSSLNK